MEQSKGYREFDNYLSSRFERGNMGSIEGYFNELELNYSAHLPSNKEANILDLGCGMGQFIRFLKSKGYTKVTGADVSREAVDYCNKNGIKDVLRIDDMGGFLADNAGKFDLIILKSVIAHFKREEVVSNLRLIRSALKDGGAILVETFNASVLTGAFAMYDDSTHKSGFTDESLYQVLHEAGFKDIKVTGNKYKIKGPKTFLWVVARKAWFLLLRMIYIIERGIGDNPRILTKLLIAVAEK